MEEPDQRATRGIEPTVPTEPARLQSLSAQREWRGSGTIAAKAPCSTIKRNDQLKWQRLTPFEELADMLLKHLEGILGYCRTKVRFGDRILQPGTSKHVWPHMQPTARSIKKSDF
jgi:hypothetical protein